MSETDSVTQWLGLLKDGHPHAAQWIWSRYVERLVNAARSKLGYTAKQVADEDDIANQAFFGFLNGVKRNQFTQLVDRYDLWQILLRLIEFRAEDQRRWNDAEKRGGNHQPTASIAFQDPDDSNADGMDQIPDPHPTPEFVQLFCDLSEHFFEKLNSEKLVRVAKLKMQGHTNEEIAEMCDVALGTAERYVKQIADTWKQMMNEGE